METENVNIKNWKSLIKPSKLDVKISDEQREYNILTNGLKKHISSMQDALCIE